MWKQIIFFLCIFSAHGIHALLKTGAKKAEYGECSYTVGIYEGIGDSFKQTCSGAILGAQFILTAAHCFFDRDLDLRNNVFLVLSGTDDVNNRRPFQEETEVAEVRVPELFFHRAKGVALLSDIAVLKLTKPMKFYQSETQNQFVQKIGLPERYLRNATPIVCGFGAASTHSVPVGYYVEEIHFQYDGNGQLYYSEANILTMTECQNKFYAPNMMLTLFHVCAKVKVQNPNTISGTCGRDAGAPLVYEGQIVGVLSNAPKQCNESVSPAIYTKVLPYRDFIQTAMETTVTDPTISVITLPSGK